MEGFAKCIKTGMMEVLPDRKRMRLDVDTLLSLLLGDPSINVDKWRAATEYIPTSFKQSKEVLGAHLGKGSSVLNGIRLNGCGRFYMSGIMHCPKQNSVSKNSRRQCTWAMGLRLVKETL